MIFNSNYDRKSVHIGTVNSEPTRTQQQFQNEVNINTIISRYKTTGVLPERGGKPVFGDFSEITDFRTAQGVVAEANQAFQALPAHLRRRFNNDPAAFIDFVSDNENRSEAEKLGIVPKKEVKPTETPAAKPAETPVKPATDSIPT